MTARARVSVPETHARSLWARLAREVASAPTSAVPVVEPVAVAGFRCARCGGYCPTCSAPPAGWATVQRPENFDIEALAAALFELDPSVDEPGVRRTRPVRCGVVSTIVDSGEPASASSRRVRLVERQDGAR